MFIHVCRMIYFQNILWDFHSKWKQNKIDKTSVIDCTEACILNVFFFSFIRKENIQTKWRVIFQLYGLARMSFVITCHRYIIARNGRAFPIVSNWREARLRTVRVAYVIRFRSSSCTCTRGTPWNPETKNWIIFSGGNISCSAFRASAKEETLLSWLRITLKQIYV